MFYSISMSHPKFGTLILFKFGTFHFVQVEFTHLLSMFMFISTFIFGHQPHFPSFFRSFYSPAFLFKLATQSPSLPFSFPAFFFG